MARKVMLAELIPTPSVLSLTIVLGLVGLNIG